MLWQEDNKKAGFDVDDSVVDLLFNIECRELPVDHIYQLSQAIHQALPGRAEDNELGVHPVHLAGSQNGWERPDESLGQNLILSKRTKLILRVRKEHQQDVVDRLHNITLDIDGFEMTVKKPKVRKLRKDSTIFSRAIVCSESETEDEMQFLNRMQQELALMGIIIKKALCGKTSQFKTPDGPVLTRSLMLADMSPEDSVKLQQTGIGPLRDMGCGIFLPHKGIEAVGESTDDEK
ncbi:MAG: type I-MYXAN CRISPR-associated protein Cas6/Cmx6 [Gammaproteobacteria bacterium]|nr:type I-MYXAN CRISPR-associated protein Cas6/Cmx6 [Gammaproteobacteria bacterium]